MKGSAVGHSDEQTFRKPIVQADICYFRAIAFYSRKGQGADQQVLIGVACIAFPGVHIEGVGLLVGDQDISLAFALLVNRNTFHIFFKILLAKQGQLPVAGVGVGIVLMYTEQFVGVIHIAQLIVHRYGFDLFFATVLAEFPHYCGRNAAIAIVRQAVLPEVTFRWTGLAANNGIQGGVCRVCI